MCFFHCVIATELGVSKTKTQQRSPKTPRTKTKTPWTKTKTPLTKTKTPWPHGLKRPMLTAEGNARSRNLLRRFGNVVEFLLQYNQVYHLPFLQVSLKIGSSSVSCGYNAPSVKRISMTSHVTSPKVISVAMGGLTIKKPYDRIRLEDFRQTCFGRVVRVWGMRGSLAFWYFIVQNSTSDDLGVIPGEMS